ncbi:P-loop NTPase [bacterium]|nr:P-loop NTPase [candidate division CSSED10-310 bacterium]
MSGRKEAHEERGQGGRDPKEQERIDMQIIGERMSRIKHKILVLSGKGGVGKSTVAANLAISLSLAGQRVGLLDIDLHGPSIPKLLDLEGRSISADGPAMAPVLMTENLKVMSIGFLLRSRNDAVIWRGPLKYGIIKQFLRDVSWGELDYLVVDSPPGTGDEPLSIAQLIGPEALPIVVTTPQELALNDVRKCITFCRQLQLHIIGLVENMSGFICPHCGQVTEIFKTGGGEALAAEMDVPFLGRIPIDPQVTVAGDEGKPYVFHYARTETAKAFERVVAPLLALDGRTAEQDSAGAAAAESGTAGRLTFALPLAAGRLAMHFGHSETFALIDVDNASKEILDSRTLDAPPHEPGLLPRWLKDAGADVIIAGGIGSRAAELFAQQNIKVVIGAPSAEPEQLVQEYLAGTLMTGDNVCDH